MAMHHESGEITHSIASQVTRAMWRDLPTEVVAHSRRLFVNFIGCAVGGSQHEAVGLAQKALGGAQESATSVVIGRSGRTSAALSALLNCISASVYAFDDTHAEAVVHPSSVIGSALIGVSGVMPSVVEGRHFLLALTWGIECMCRLSKALSVPPARADMGWSQSGVTGAVGAAAACGKLLGLELSQMTSAIGIAACLSSGLRAAHGTMTMHLVPAQASSLGVQAALLARAGFTGPGNGLEGTHGYLSLFSQSAYIPSLVGELGTRFELLANGVKAYPCGIVIHAVIDACLQLYAQHGNLSAQIVHVQLLVPETAIRLADRPHPRNVFEAQVSVQHWAAAVLIAGTAGILQGSQAVIDDGRVRDLRARCHLTLVSAMGFDAAAIRVALLGGGTIESEITHFKGSLANPLSEGAIEEKFLGQSAPVLGADRARTLLKGCRSVTNLDDIGGIL